MLQYNLIDQQCAEMIEQARIHGIGILAGGPFKRGYLTGEYRSFSDFSDKDDYWKWNLKLNRKKVEQILGAVSELLEIYETPPKLRQYSLQFILQQAGVSSCIVGHRNIQEVIENINATETQDAESIAKSVLDKIMHNHLEKNN
ncbi:MAG: hypothetical protein Tsb005_14410 [Gammaproteobacteria bacterium]